MTLNARLGSAIAVAMLTPLAATMAGQVPQREASPKATVLWQFEAGG